MPFDATPAIDLHTFKRGHDGLRQLSVALRQEMPRGFTWNFKIPEEKNRCGTVGCALGLANVMWRGQVGDFTMSPAMFFGMSVIDASIIFWSSASYYKDMSDITPHDVADKIDRYLAKHAPGQ